MEKENLFDNEQIITESGDKSVTLTTHRLRYNASTWGKAHIVSIMLEKISSIEVHYRSKWVLLIIAIILMLGGFAAGMSNQYQARLGLLAVAVGAVLLLIYLFTRRHVVSIASDGGAKINFETKGMKREVVIDFVNKVEKAKSTGYSNRKQITS